MLTESAQVVAVEKLGVWLQTVRTSACESCKAKSGCGQHAMAKLSDGERQERATQIFVETQQAHRIGDWVTLAIPEAAMLHSAWLMYGLPLVALLVGVGGVSLLGAPEWLQMVTAVLSLAVGLTAVRGIAGARLNHDAMYPRIVYNQESELLTPDQTT